MLLTLYYNGYINQLSENSNQAMTNLFITSDTHFGHKRILEFNPQTRLQYGSTTEEMDRGMVEAWNSLIGADDLVYHLGDVSFHKMTRTLEILRSLNGRKILIAGNHDTKALKNFEFIACFEEIHQYLEIKVDGVKVILMHFPISCFNMAKYGSVHAYGHLHGGFNGMADQNRRMGDVGVDATGKIAIKLNDFVAEMLKRPAIDNRY